MNMNTIKKIFFVLSVVSIVISGVSFGEERIEYLHHGKIFQLKTSKRFIILDAAPNKVDSYGFKKYQPKGDNEIENQLLKLIEARRSHLYVISTTSNVDTIWLDDEIKIISPLFYSANLDENKFKTIVPYLFSAGNYLRIRTYKRNDHANLHALVRKYDLRTFPNQELPAIVVTLKKNRHQNIFQVAAEIEGESWVNFAYPLINNPRSRTLPVFNE